MCLIRSQLWKDDCHFLLCGGIYLNVTSKLKDAIRREIAGVSKTEYGMLICDQCFLCSLVNCTIHISVFHLDIILARGGGGGGGGGGGMVYVIN